MTAPLPKLCNIASYLFEQELTCRRMERAMHSDSPAGQEWNRIAENLLLLRIAHAESCRVCKNP